MYRRKEDIEVESLDWKSHAVPPASEKDTQIAKVILSPVPKHDRTSVYEKVEPVEKLDIKRKATDLLDENLRLFLIFTILIFPYIVGFSVSYFLFYLYADISIGDFFMMQQGHLHLELWAIGIYLLITVGMIWVVFKSLFSSFKI